MISNIINDISTYSKMLKRVEEYVINKCSRVISNSSGLQDMRLKKISQKNI